MVDMEGIDLLAAQGETIPGLYNKLVESIALCRYQCVYNWSFNSILIPPTYVEMEEREDGVWINEGVMVDEEDVVHIASIEPEPPTPILPVIEELSVTENDTYTVPQGVDGFNPVVVNVPSEGGIEFRTTVPLDSEGSDGDVCAIYPDISSFRFFRLTISAVRSSGCQMSEIKFLSQGNVVQIPAGTTITSSASPYSPSESVDKLLDGNTSTKFYTTTVPLTINIEFPEEVDFDEWQWYTANDSPGRDPTSFYVEISSDGIDWTTVDSATGYIPTETRYVLAYTGELLVVGVYEVLIKENGTWVNIIGYNPE